METRAIQILSGEKSSKTNSWRLKTSETCTNSVCYKCSAVLKANPCMCVLILTYISILKSRS